MRNGNPGRLHRSGDWRSAESDGLSIAVAGADVPRSFSTVRLSGYMEKALAAALGSIHAALAAGMAQAAPDRFEAESLGVEIPDRGGGLTAWKRIIPGKPRACAIMNTGFLVKSTRHMVLTMPNYMRCSSKSAHARSFLHVMGTFASKVLA
jgi:hypothetical protein